MIDQPHIKLLKAVPQDGIVVETKQDGNIVHISIGKAASEGTLAVLTFQPEDTVAGLLNLSLQNPKAEQEDKVQIRSAVALPKQITISQ